MALGRLSTLSSYRAEGTGALVIVYLMARLYTYLNLPSPPTVTHFCDNKGLVHKVKHLKSTPPGAWKKNVNDADLLSEIVYQATKFEHVFKWDQGHPERRKERCDWSYCEWGNYLADGLAAEAWNLEDAYESSSQFAPQLPHAASLALHLTDGSLHGNIKRVLPPIITATNGHQQLARYIHYNDQQLAAVDWEILQQSSKSFTTTALARFYFCKSFNSQWYTDAQAHTFNPSLSPTCR